MSVSPRPGRTPLHSRLTRRLQAPPLLRWLDGLDSAAHHNEAGSPSFAEQLSPWLGWTDAIALSSVLPAVDPSAARPAARLPQPEPAVLARARSVAAEVRCVQAALAQAIRSDTTASHGRQQHAMETQIGPARARLRAALAACTPALRQLAALDEVLERALATRERSLLASLPALFKQQQALAAPGDPAAPAEDPTALRELMLAELQARWQPVAGLLEALDALETRAAPVAAQPPARA